MLLVALLMLLVLTMLGVAGITSTNINLQLVQNQQRQMEVEQVALNVIEFVLSDEDYFLKKNSHTLAQILADVPAGYIDGRTVTLDRLDCLYQIAVGGSSMNQDPSAVSGGVVGVTNEKFDYYWEAEVSVTDPSSGATESIVQGFKYRFKDADCPA